jgi:hypothetical protein
MSTNSSASQHAPGVTRNGLFLQPTSSPFGEYRAHLAGDRRSISALHLGDALSQQQRLDHLGAGDHLVTRLVAPLAFPIAPLSRTLLGGPALSGRIDQGEAAGRWQSWSRRPCYNFRVGQFR